MAARRGGRSYRLTPRAVRDLEDIWQYSARTRSVAQADAYQSDLAVAFEGLAAGTKVGRRVTNREGYHRFAIGSHVVFYREVELVLEVIRVLHQRMDPERHL